MNQSVYTCLMRDEKEGRKKQARSNKQRVPGLPDLCKIGLLFKNLCSVAPLFVYH